MGVIFVYTIPSFLRIYMSVIEYKFEQYKTLGPIIYKREKYKLQVELLKLQEDNTKATALEYDCEQGDHSFFGFPHESNYRSYQPYKALIR